MATVTLRGTDIHTNGDLPAVGSDAPDFSLTTGELSEVGRSDYPGMQLVLNIVPSLDTPTCATSTRRFNEEAASMDNTTVLVISADLPFAQARFCETNGIDKVVPLSMMRNRNFAKDYGVLIQDGPLAGLTARAVVVIDSDGRVKHSELVPEIAQEPDYQAALNAL
jgi:thiol peroxidase